VFQDIFALFSDFVLFFYCVSVILFVNKKQKRGFTMKYILAIDSGTTSTRAIVFNGTSELMSYSLPITQNYPKPGWVEHDANEIWNTAYECARNAIARRLFSRDIACIGITNQRETVVVWDKNTSEPVGNAIVWQCRRTADYCNALVREGYTETIKRKTGLTLNAYFSASKLKWFLDNTPGARERAERGELLFGTVDSWLIWKFTEGRVHATDATNASRTMLYNIRTQRWDEDLLELFGIPEAMLPEVLSCDGDFGTTRLFGTEIPITGVAGDQHAALFGQCCFNTGDAKTTYGTGAFLLMNTGSVACRSTKGLVTTLSWKLKNEVTYALEGSVFVAGALISWLRDEMGFITSSEESERLASSVPDNGGVYIVPAFVGLGAPYWDSYARGTIVGLTRGTTKAHIMRAALEAIAFEVNDVISLMQLESNLRISEMKADGGASANRLLMQLQANISRIKIKQPPTTETTALGAAMLAGLGAGIYRDTGSLEREWQLKCSFSPITQENERQKMLKNWQRAVERSKAWAQEDDNE